MTWNLIRKRMCCCASAFPFAIATIAGRDGVAVRASLGMAEEGADALIELRADDVFEPAGLGVGLGVIGREGVFEEALGQSMPAHYAPRALAADWRKLCFAVLHFDQMPLAHPA